VMNKPTAVHHIPAVTARVVVLHEQVVGAVLGLGTPHRRGCFHGVTSAQPDTGWRRKEWTG
jgi:hypothetical protein